MCVQKGRVTFKRPKNCGGHFPVKIDSAKGQMFSK